MARAKDEIVNYLQPLHAYAMNLTRNRAQAEDLVQDTVVKAWSNIDKFQVGTNMRAWLFTILRNTYYSAGRKSRREVEDVDGVHAERLSEKPSHDGRLAMRDFSAAFSKLPQEQRRAITLVGANGYSYEEAARMCDCEVGTIKSRVARGRSRLTRLMELGTDEPLEMTDVATTAVVAQRTSI